MFLEFAMKVKFFGLFNMIFAVLAAGWILCMPTSPSLAQPLGQTCPENPKKTGTFVFDGESQAFFIGYRWGQGVLTLENGREYEFSVRGMKVGEIGTRSARIAGDVYGLESLEDFIGHYQGTTGGGFAVVGRSETKLVNSRCVTLVAKTNESGWNFSLESKQSVVIQFSDN